MFRELMTSEINTIKLALRVAAKRFEEDSQDFSKIKDAGGISMSTSQGASRLQEQFIQQHEDCLKLLEKINEVY